MSKNNEDELAPDSGWVIRIRVNVLSLSIALSGWIALAILLVWLISKGM